MYKYKLILIIFFVCGKATKCPNVNGVSYVENDCKKYYKCLPSGNEVTETCPDGLVFNCLSGECEKTLWPSCCYKDPLVDTYKVDTHCPVDGISSRDPKNCSKYYYCLNGEYRNGSCDSGKYYSLKESNCVDGSCQTQIKSNVHKREIPERSGELKREKRQANVTTTTPAPQIVCTKNGQKWADPDACSKYFVCRYGNANPKQCLPLFSWNCFQNRCSLFKLRECCPNDPNVNKGWSSNFCLIQSKTAMNPANATQYFACDNRRIVTKSCNGTDVYIPELYKCGNRAKYLDLVNSIM